MFNKINLLYEIWNIDGHLPNCLDETVLKFMIYQYPKLRHEERHIPYVGEKSLGPRFNMWTNDIGFTIAKMHFNPINFTEAKNIKNWVYPIEPWGHLMHSIDFDVHKGQIRKNFFKYVHEDVIHEINKGMGKILVNYAHEGWVSDWVLRTFYEAIKDANINPKGVILLLNDINLDEKLEKFFKKNSFIDKSNFPIIINYCYYVIQSGAFFRYTPEMKINYDEYQQNKKYKFLFLNRRLNLHRFFLLGNLYEEIKEESGISFDKDLIIDDLKRIIENEQYPGHFTDSSKQLYHNASVLLEKLPQNSFLDTTQLNSTNGYRHHATEPFKESWISIVTETSFFEENDFISEKTWKPLWHFQPFIVAGRPYTLKYLKELGYKTFDWLFDEGYDLIEDDAQRLLFIEKEIRRVNKIPFEELKNLILNNKETLIHNHNVLKNYGESRLYFEKKLIDICNSDLTFDYCDLIQEKYKKYEKTI